MKTETILKAIDALRKARHALISGQLPISEQIALGSECFTAAWNLQYELVKDVPEVKAETAA